MAEKRCVRITTDEPFGAASIVDAETGEPIKYVTHVTIDMPPSGPFVATLDVWSEVDIVAEAKIEKIDSEARRLLSAVVDAWLQLPVRYNPPQMKAPIKAAVEWLRTHPEREAPGGDAR